MSDRLPYRKFINGEHWHLVVGHVVGRKDGKLDGEPSLIRIMKEGDTISLSGGEEFITMYVKESVIPPG